MRGAASLCRIVNWCDHSVVNEPPDSCEAMFVLAGRSSRKRYALTLNKDRSDRVLLMSVARFEIRGLPSFGLAMPFDLVSRALVLKPPGRHFFVTLHGNQVKEIHYVPAHRLGTLREIMALAAWLRMHPKVQSLIIISSSFHLPRVRLCCEAVLPKWVQMKLVPVPNEQAYGHSHIFERVRLIVAESAKL